MCVRIRALKRILRQIHVLKIDVVKMELRGDVRRRGKQTDKAQDRTEHYYRCS